MIGKEFIKFSFIGFLITCMRLLVNLFIKYCTILPVIGIFTGGVWDELDVNILFRLVIKQTETQRRISNATATVGITALTT